MKKKIAIVRGSNLNKWEMQNYEGLQKDFDVTGFNAKNGFFDTSEITFPIVTLPSKEKFKSRIPGTTTLSKWMQGSSQELKGLEKKLHDFDLVHTACLESYYTKQCILAKKKNPKLKVVATIWENIPFAHEDFRKQKELKYFNLKSIDLFLAMSKRAAFALEKEGVPSEKIKLFYIGIDAEKFQPRQKDSEFLKKLQVNENDFIITTIGRLVWEKGIQDVLVAVSGLIKENPRVKYLVVGEGKLEDKFKELATRLGVEKNVIFTSVPYKEVPKVLNSSDLFVLPSIPMRKWQEQLGMAIIEAMSSGLPVITSNSGSIDEVVGDDGAGALVPPADPYSLSKEIGKLSQDENLRNEMGKKARQRVLENFDARKKSPELSEIYREVLGDS